MSVRQYHSSEPNLYFITFTCYNWLPLLQTTNSYDIVYKWFDYLKEKKKIKVTAYVIMPNHLHTILYFPTANFSLNSIISNAKRFMAYEIIKRLEQQNNKVLLQQLADAVSPKERIKGQQHKVFKESFDAKAIDSEAFLMQKLNYIHLNPVRGNYQLVKDWRVYEHSSASFYELQQTGHFTPVHFRDLE
jgi:putative transposase